MSSYVPAPSAPGVVPGTVVLTAKVQCPLCAWVPSARLLHSLFPYHLLLTCTRLNRKLERTCGAAYWVIALPPGATAHALLTIFSPPIAERVYRRIAPAVREIDFDEAPAALWAAPLVADGARAFIIAPVPGHVAHRLADSGAGGDEIARSLQLHR